MISCNMILDTISTLDLDVGDLPIIAVKGMKLQLEVVCEFIMEVCLNLKSTQGRVFHGYI